MNFILSQKIHNFKYFNSVLLSGQYEVQKLLFFPLKCQLPSKIIVRVNEFSASITSCIMHSLKTKGPYPRLFYFSPCLRPLTLVPRTFLFLINQSYPEHTSSSPQRIFTAFCFLIPFHLSPSLKSLSLKISYYLNSKFVSRGVTFFVYFL